MRAPRETPTTRWVFTLNNWTQDEYKTITTALHTYAKYWVIGKEVGQNGTPHLQGFAIMRLRERLTAMKRVLGTQRLHLEKARGTSLQAATYCKKDGDFIEEGELPGTPTIKNSFQEQCMRAKTAVEEGASLQDLWEHHFFVMLRHQKQMEHYHRMWTLRTFDRKKPRVEVIWGMSGTGKTRYVMQQVKLFYENDYWVYPGKGWFDGYTGQQVAIFDDFYGDIDFGTFLKVLDRYRYEAPIKGGHTLWNPVRIYITSNVSPAEWYEKANLKQYQRDAMMRRFDLIHEVFYDIFE